MGAGLICSEEIPKTSSIPPPPMLIRHAFWSGKVTTHYSLLIFPLLATLVQRSNETLDHTLSIFTQSKALSHFFLGGWVIFGELH